MPIAEDYRDDLSDRASQDRPNCGEDSEERDD